MDHASFADVDDVELCARTRPVNRRGIAKNFSGLTDLAYSHSRAHPTRRPPCIAQPPQAVPSRSSSHRTVLRYPAARPAEERDQDADAADLICGGLLRVSSRHRTSGP